MYETRYEVMKMSDHICTNESLCNEMKLDKATCIVCCTPNAESSAGYGGIHLKCCNTVIDDSTDKCCIVRRRRTLLELKRKELAELFDKSQYTIKSYEWVKCSKEYFDFTTKLMEEKNGKKL